MANLLSLVPSFQLYRSECWGTPFEHKHNDKPVSRLIELKPISCPIMDPSHVILVYFMMSFWNGSIYNNLWLGTQMMDLDPSSDLDLGTFPWGAPPDPTWFSYTKLPIQHPRSNGSGDWRHLRCLETPRPETFDGESHRKKMGCRVNYQLLGLNRVHLNLHPNPMDYKSYIYIYINHISYIYICIYICHFPIETCVFWGM